MAKLEIIQFPEPVLRKTAAPVERIDEETRQLLDDMMETMRAAPGVGLAAPQIGLSRRIFVMDPARDKEEPDPHFIINPDILESGDEMRVYEEGCLSIPGIYAEVERPSRILMRYINRDGEQREDWFEGHAATVAQHEFDHLNGVMFIDHLSRLKRNVLIRKFRKMRKSEDGEA
ncbi:MAG TPA: peptide deformylase [Hyphomicrobiales bacterium]|nr:peptide deformylase [Hyphomicrobiales bacterium]